jgi:hypothetical protein
MKKVEPHGFGEAVRFALIMEVFLQAKRWGMFRLNENG